MPVLPWPLMRERRMVTLAASMTTTPVMSAASMWGLGGVMVVSPRGVRVIPVGVPAWGVGGGVVGVGAVGGGVIAGGGRGVGVGGGGAVAAGGGGGVGGGWRGGFDG